MTEALEGCGVLIHTIRKGDGVHFPKDGDFCIIEYKTVLEGQEHQECPVAGEKLSFSVGQNQVILGLDVGVQSMSLGAVCELTIPSLYAYANEGCPPHIPPHAVLVLRVELVAIGGLATNRGGTPNGPSEAPLPMKTA